jgi:hypothetical protein
LSLTGQRYDHHRENPTCIRHRHMHMPGGVLPIEFLYGMQCIVYSGGV